MIRPFHGIHPLIDPTAFVAETAVIIGDADIEAGVAQLKDLASGAQEAVPFGALVERLA